MEEIEVKITVGGEVQGVGFRFFTYQLARSAGLLGTVKNSPDGSVEIVAQGKKEVVKAFIDNLKEGPGRVAQVQWERQPQRHSFAAFDIIS